MPKIGMVEVQFSQILFLTNLYIDAMDFERIKVILISGLPASYTKKYS